MKKRLKRFQDVKTRYEGSHYMCDEVCSGCYGLCITPGMAKNFGKTHDVEVDHCKSEFFGKLQYRWPGGTYYCAMWFEEEEQNFDY